MFIGREKELRRLEMMYDSNKFEFAIVYGRRRVGKTTLITQFADKYKNIFFACQKASNEDNLAELSKVISSYIGYNIVFSSFIEAFRAIIKLAENERLIFILDEYPNLAEKDNNAISSIFQNLIDHECRNTKLFLIISGSSLPFMKDDVLGKNSPLYGRSTGIFRIQPFDYLSSAAFVPSYSYEDKTLVYGITGGIPRYLELFNDKHTIKENLLYNLFDTNSVLFNERDNYLKEEFKEVSTYNSILTAIASGCTKLSEIANRSGIQVGTLPKYLSKLKEVGIIERIVPMGETEKKGVWQISDLFFRFYFFFVQKNISTITSGRMEKYYDTLITPLLNDYMGKVFEKIVNEYIETYAELPFPIETIGTWWGGSRKLKKEIEIDLIAASAISNQRILASVKYRNRKTPEAELGLMKDYASESGEGYEDIFWFFSKSGFEDDFHESDNVKLFTLDDIYSIKR